MLKYQIEIAIKDLNIDSRYFSFKWNATLNGKIFYGTYDSDHSRGDDLEKFKEALENGYALELAMESLGNCLNGDRHDL